MYWLEKNKYKEKWTYLSECYNKIIGSRDYTRPIKYMDINTSIMLNALAIDILVTMMWGHRYFKELFLGESIKAVDHFIGNTTDSIKLLKNSYFSEDELVFILENYQLELMSYKTLKDVDVKLKGRWLDDAKKETKFVNASL